MFKIGDFSQLGQVSVRTLRHYDELGLLKPGQIDQFTSYRYYTIEQLPRLHRILALKDLGLSLDEIGGLLETDLPVERLHRLLVNKQRAIEVQLREEGARLARVADRIRQLEQAGQPPHYEVVTKSLPAQTIVATRATVPRVEEMMRYRKRLLTQLYTWLQQHQLVYGTELVIYHPHFYTDVDIDMSIAVNIAPTLSLPDSSAAAGIASRQLPAAPLAASTVHHGPMPQIPEVVSNLYRWLGTHGYTSTGPYREIHLFGREIDLYTGADEFPHVVFEIQIPIEKF